MINNMYNAECIEGLGVLFEQQKPKAVPSLVY